MTTLANGHCLSAPVHELAAPRNGPDAARRSRRNGRSADRGGDGETPDPSTQRDQAIARGRVLASRRQPVRLSAALPPYAPGHEQPQSLLPGRPDGLFSEQRVGCTSEHLLAHADVLVALHSGGAFQDNVIPDRSTTSTWQRRSGPSLSCLGRVIRGHWRWRRGARRTCRRR